MIRPELLADAPLAKRLMLVMSPSPTVEIATLLDDRPTWVVTCRSEANRKALEEISRQDTRNVYWTATGVPCGEVEAEKRRMYLEQMVFYFDESNGVYVADTWGFWEEITVVGFPLTRELKASLEQEWRLSYAIVDSLRETDWGWIATRSSPRLEAVVERLRALRQGLPFPPEPERGPIRETLARFLRATGLIRLAPDVELWSNYRQYARVIDRYGPDSWIMPIGSWEHFEGFLRWNHLSTCWDFLRYTGERIGLGRRFWEEMAEIAKMLSDSEREKHAQAIAESAGSSTAPTAPSVFRPREAP